MSVEYITTESKSLTNILADLKKAQPNFFSGSELVFYVSIDLLKDSGLKHGDTFEGHKIFTSGLIPPKQAFLQPLITIPNFE